MDQGVPAPAQLIPGARSRRGRPGENDEGKHDVQALTTGRPTPTTVPGASDRRIPTGTRHERSGRHGRTVRYIGRSFPIVHCPTSRPRPSRRRPDEFADLTPPPGLADRVELGIDHPTNPANQSFRIRCTRNGFGQKVTETRPPAIGRDTPDQADDRVVHFDAGRDAVDREPSTVGHHDGVVLQCHRAAPARAREFDLPDQVRDQLRGLRGRQSRDREQCRQGDAGTADIETATRVVGDRFGRFRSGHGGLATARVDSQGCFVHRASPKRSASRRWHRTGAGGRWTWLCLLVSKSLAPGRIYLTPIRSDEGRNHEGGEARARLGTHHPNGLPSPVPAGTDRGRRFV